MSLDLDAIEERYRRVWRDTEDGKRLSLTSRLVAAQESAGDVPALAAHAREEESEVRRLRQVLRTIVDECSDPYVWHIAHDALTQPRPRARRSL